MKNDTGSKFKELYMTTCPRLVAFVSRFAPEDARDIVQDSFMKFLDKYPEAVGEEAENIIFTITRNNCINYLKKKKIEKGMDLAFLEHISGEEALYHLDFTGDSPYERCVKDELIDMINTIIAGLPPRCREVFLLSRDAGLTNRGIAQKLGISRTAVEKHIRRALREFSEQLPAMGISDSKIRLLLLAIFCGI